jgi:uncharacterized protein (DUF488 family)
VRQIAFSRKKGFSKRALSEVLATIGIRYDHLPSLGSPAAARHRVRIDHNYTALFAATRKAFKSEQAQTALAQVARIAKQRRTALLCFCADPKRCHRKVVIEQLSQFSFEHL